MLTIRRSFKVALLLLVTSLVTASCRSSSPPGASRIATEGATADAPYNASIGQPSITGAAASAAATPMTRYFSASGTIRLQAGLMSDTTTALPFVRSATSSKSQQYSLLGRSRDLALGIKFGGSTAVSPDGQWEISMLGVVIPRPDAPNGGFTSMTFRLREPLRVAVLEPTTMEGPVLTVDGGYRVSVARNGSQYRFVVAPVDANSATITSAELVLDGQGNPLDWTALQINIRAEGSGWKVTGEVNLEEASESQYRNYVDSEL